MRLAPRQLCSRSAPHRAAVKGPSFWKSFSSCVDGARAHTVAAAESYGTMNYGVLFGLGFFCHSPFLSFQINDDPSDGKDDFCQAHG